jgi:hypothetical protein
MIDGRTVSEIKGEARSAEEVKLLWDYISQRLNRAARANLATTIATESAGMQA